MQIQSRINMYHIYIQINAVYSVDVSVQFLSICLKDCTKYISQVAEAFEKKAGQIKVSTETTEGALLWWMQYTVAVNLLCHSGEIAASHMLGLTF